MRITAYIPVVNQGYERLQSVYCERSAEATVTGANPEAQTIEVVRGLATVGLHLSGKNAKVAAEKLMNSRQKIAAELDGLRLYAGERAGAVEQNSGELALALLLLAGGVGRYGLPPFAATGTLGANPSAQLYDVGIEAVADVGKKLHGLLQEAKAGHIHGLHYCFVPQANWDGLDTEERRTVASLRRQYGIQVVPVASLRQAAQQLGLFRALRRNMALQHVQALVQRRWRWALAGLGVLLPTLFGLWSIHSVDMAFLAETAPGEHLPAEPFLVCDRQRWDYRPLSHADGKNSAPQGGELGWAVRIGTTEGWTHGLYRLFAWFGYPGYPIAYAMLSERSPEPLRVYRASEDDSNQPLRIAPGASWRASVKLEPLPDLAYLIVLAKPWLDYDEQTLESMRREVLQALLPDGPTGRWDMQAAAARFSHYGSTLAYVLEITENPSPCGGPAGTGPS